MQVLNLLASYVADHKKIKKEKNFVSAFELAYDSM